MSKLDYKYIRQIEQKTGLRFLEERVEGNLCYAQNNSDLRDDFKSIFTISDFNFFKLNFLDKNIEIPTDFATFWKLVKKGKEMSEI